MSGQEPFVHPTYRLEAGNVTLDRSSLSEQNVQLLAKFYSQIWQYIVALVHAGRKTRRERLHTATIGPGFRSWALRSSRSLRTSFQNFAPEGQCSAQQNAVAPYSGTKRRNWSSPPLAKLECQRPARLSATGFCLGKRSLAHPPSCSTIHGSRNSRIWTLALMPDLVFARNLVLFYHLLHQTLLNPVLGENIADRLLHFL